MSTSLPRSTVSRASQISKGAGTFSTSRGPGSSRPSTSSSRRRNWRLGCARCASRLLAARDKRPAPLCDDKVLTGWNGLMIAAYADGYRVLKVEKYRQAAEKAAGFLLDKLRLPDGRLLRTYRQGQAKLPAYLEDYAFLAHGLIRLHAATGDARWLQEARALAERMIADFEDREEGGFFFTAVGHESLLARAKDPFDNALPSGNSMAILDLMALYRATGEASYRDHAGKALDAFSTSLSQVPGRDAGGRDRPGAISRFQARQVAVKRAGPRHARRHSRPGRHGHRAPGRRDAGRDRARP